MKRYVALSHCRGKEKLPILETEARDYLGNSPAILQEKLLQIFDIFSAYHGLSFLLLRPVFL